MFRILLVDDDPEFNRSSSIFLKREGYAVDSVYSGDEAYEALFRNAYDMVITDIMMKDVDGFELVRAIRGINENIPIIFVSARDDFRAKERGFALGIDDYMVKPLDLDELSLRVKALFRRALIASSRKIEFGAFSMDADERSATYKGEEIQFTQREFDILFKMLSYPKKTFTRAQLMDEFWDVNTNSGTRTVDVYMTKIRDKTEKVEEFAIMTVHGLGYKAVLL